jgi:vacuolar-type H+-ATPase subunit H
MKEEIRDEIEAEWEKILEDAKKELSADALKLTFYNSYGETEWGEDMATFAEYMMHRGRYQMLTNLCEGRIEDAYRDRNSIRYDAPKKIKTMENIRKAAPFIKRKVELMKKAFKISTMGIMGENFWQDFLRIHQTRP